MIFTVGVTGHRWNGLEQADTELLNKQVEMVLENIQQTVKTVDPTATLHLLSPVAEGSDRIVAYTALRLGYTLHCILPFAKSIYEEDFESKDSKEEFRALLERAAKVIELLNQPHSNETRNAAYTEAGRKVTADSNVLLAIWDGEKARGEGGTGQMVEEALAQNRLVVWINAKAPHEIYLLKEDGTRADVSALSRKIERILGGKRRGGEEEKRN
jgi:hypothetical protein